MFDPSELTDDGFLGGALRILQPREGYRAATDPVFLASAVPAEPGQTVLELGCGAGVASLCLAHRVAGLSLIGLELQPAYAELAQANAARNRMALKVVTGDLAAMPGELRAEAFDQVLANPPYYPAGGGTAARDAGRETALREATPLALWVDAAARRLRPGGWLTLIQRADRLDELLSAVDTRLGSLAILPMAPREGRPANRVILRARKGGRGALRLLAPFVVHEGPDHRGDGEDLSALARSVLRGGGSLDAAYRV